MPLMDEVVLPLLDPAVAPEEWVTGIAAVLEDPLFTNTWSIDAGSACRVVFAFENGARVTWCGGGDVSPAVLVQVWSDGKEDSPPVNGDISPLATPHDAAWDERSQVWATAATPAGVAAIVTEAVSLWGPAALLLPWDEFVNGEEIEILLAEIPEGMSLARGVAAMHTEDADALGETLVDEWGASLIGTPIMAAAGRNEVVIPSAWGGGTGKVVNGADSLPPASPNVRFCLMVDLIDKRPDWVVVWDECCGSCARGSLDSAWSMKGLPEGSPSVVLFAQNSQYAFPPDGSVSYILYQGDEGEAAVLEAAAAEVGLHTTRENGSHVIFY